MRTLMKFGCGWRKISHKSKCKKDSESTSNTNGGIVVRKHIFLFLLFILSGCFLLPSETLAFQHAYESNSDFIYALGRNELPVYYSDYSNDLKTILPKYTGIKVIGSSGSWYEIQYTSKKGGTKSGWITKDEFHSDCLIYDGKEKQPFANGTYQLSFYEKQATTATHPLNIYSATPVKLSCSFEYVGDNCYMICKTGENKYLKADTSYEDTSSSNELWGDKEEAGTFLISRKDDYYTICDAFTRQILSQNTSGLLEFTNDSNAVWRLVRTQKAIEKENLHVFVQFNPTWAKHHYGNETTKDTDTNNFCTSGCGIFATVNTIYSLTGHFPDPYELAKYASDKHYRIEDCGTDCRFFKAAAQKFGHKYGFSYDGNGESFKELKKKLKDGDTAVVYLPGHYGAIVDYNAKKNKFLLMDPHYLPKRGTSSFGDWVSQKDLEEGSLMVQTFFYYKAEED